MSTVFFLRHRTHHSSFTRSLEELTASFESEPIHDLRNSAATILLSMGVHPKVVQELLGHSQIGMTMDTYSHVLPTMQKDVMERLDSVFGEQA